MALQASIINMNSDRDIAKQEEYLIGIIADNNLVTKNLKELSNEWIHPNIRIVNNFKSTKMQDWSTNDRAGYAGNWTLDVLVNDSIVARPTGAFTLSLG